MLRQDVGQDLFLVTKAAGHGYQVERKVVWGAKDTETDFGDKAFLVLVQPGEEYSPKPENAMVFEHGSELEKFVGAFEDRNVADSVCQHLNSN